MTSFEINFTLDTICPDEQYGVKKWTDKCSGHISQNGALDRFRETDDGKNVKFVIKYSPYQLYPEASQEPQDKKEFYKTTNYAQTEEKFKMYSTYMQVLGHYQEEKGPETADKIVKSLYKQYFEDEKSPSAEETLLKAATDAGIPEADAKDFIADKNEGLMDTKMAIREQTGNGVDSVPSIIIEGKRRDLSLVGAKEIEEYEKALQTILKESK